MKPCEDCNRACRDLRHYRLFSLGCTTCGARLLWALTQLQLAPADLRRRQQRNLRDWVERGHREATLLRLSGQDWEGWASEHRRRH